MSCAAWVGAIGVALNGWGKPASDMLTEDHALVERAAKGIIDVTRMALHREGWAAFTHEASWALNSLYERAESMSSELSSSLRELAAEVKAKMNDQMQATRQAECMLAKFAKEDVSC